MTKNPLEAATRAALLTSFSALLLSPCALAQTTAADAVELGKVKVTGSRISRTDIETSQPVLVVDRDYIDRTGQVSIGDVLQELPIAGSALNTVVNNGGNGSTFIDLRGLGANRTLVLVNGRRWVQNGGFGATDLNTIPVSVIERVEILKDGASAIYGSDAIGGVVNIITRRDFDGVELNGQYGEFDEGDGQTKHASLSIGHTWNETNAFLDFSYYDNDDVMAEDRDIADVPVYGTGNTRGSSATPQGYFQLFDWFPDANGCLESGDFAFGGCFYEVTTEPGSPQPQGLEDFRRFADPDDRFNYAPDNYLWTPSERWNLFGQATHQLTDSIALQVDGYYHHRESSQELAPQPLFIGFGDPLFSPTVSATNPYNPFGVDLADFFLNPPQPGVLNYVSLRRRMEEGQSRRFEQDLDLWRGSAGLEGSFDAFDRYFDWDVFYSYSDVETDESTQGRYDADRLARALGPVDECTGADDGCVPLNLFGGQGVDGSGTITPEMLAYISTFEDSVEEFTSQQFAANLTGDLFDLPAGTLAFALGYEFRKEEGKFKPDESIQEGNNGSFAFRGVDSDQDIHEAYVELVVPVLADMRFAHTLELSAAARYSDYSTFGDDTTGKLGAKWKPFADLLLRGSISEGFRAPNIEEFGTLPTENFFGTGDDPCSDLFDGTKSQTVIDNCIDDGVPADGSYVQDDERAVLHITGSNPELQPETSDNYTLGLVYTPSWLDPLAFYVDWFRIELEDAIDFNFDVLGFCYESSARAFCDRVDRAVSGEITRIIETNDNLGEIEIEGVDFTAIYTSRPTRIGTFGVNWIASYLETYDVTVVGPAGSDTISQVGRNEGDDAFPRWKSNLDLTWSYGQWGATWSMRYVHHMEEDCGDFLDFTPDSLSALGLCSTPNQNPDGSPIFDDEGNIVEASNKLGSVTYHDIQVTYDFDRWDLRVTGGVRNIGDKDPPICTQCFANSFDVTTYEIPGRYPYLRITARF